MLMVRRCRSGSPSMLGARYPRAKPPADRLSHILRADHMRKHADPKVSSRGVTAGQPRTSCLTQHHTSTMLGMHLWAPVNIKAADLPGNAL